MKFVKPGKGRKTITNADSRPFGELALSPVAQRWAHCHHILETATPLGRDCGLLCGARCCAGGPEDGMLLFPGEELLYQEMGLPDGWKIQDSSIRLPGRATPVQLLVCSGTCDRPLRPLSCRIFPLLPRMDVRGGIRLEPDLRALPICPLLTSAGEPTHRIRPSFVRAVEEVFAFAIREPGVPELLDLLRQENNALGRFLR